MGQAWVKYGSTLCLYIDNGSFILIDKYFVVLLLHDSTEKF